MRVVVMVSLPALNNSENGDHKISSSGDDASCYLKPVGENNTTYGSCSSASGPVFTRQRGSYHLGMNDTDDDATYNMRPPGNMCNRVYSVVRCLQRLRMRRFISNNLVFSNLCQPLLLLFSMPLLKLIPYD